VAQVILLGPKVGSHPAIVSHSSDEPGELSQWQCHDDSTINTVVHYYYYYYYYYYSVMLFQFYLCFIIIIIIITIKH